MIGCGNQNVTRGPIIKLLKKHGNKALEFTHLTYVVSPLRDCVDLVKEKNAVHTLGVLKHMPEVCACFSEKAAHHCGEIQGEQRQIELLR